MTTQPTQPTQATQPQRLRADRVAVILTVIFLCWLCTVCAWFNFPSEDEPLTMATATIAPLVGEEVQNKAEPPPTEPPPPTDTPLPTNTPLPTPTPTMQVSVWKPSIIGYIVYEADMYQVYTSTFKVEACQYSNIILNGQTQHFYLLVPPGFQWPGDPTARFASFEVEIVPTAQRVCFFQVAKLISYQPFDQIVTDHPIVRLDGQPALSPYGESFAEQLGDAVSDEEPDATPTIIRVGNTGPGITPSPGTAAPRPQSSTPTPELVNNFGWVTLFDEGCPLTNIAIENQTGKYPIVMDDPPVYLLNQFVSVKGFMTDICGWPGIRVERLDLSSTPTPLPTARPDVTDTPEPTGTPRLVTLLGEVHGNGRCSVTSYWMETDNGIHYDLLVFEHIEFGYAYVSGREYKQDEAGCVNLIRVDEHDLVTPTPTRTPRYEPIGDWEEIE